LALFVASPWAPNISSSTNLTMNTVFVLKVIIASCGSITAYNCGSGPEAECHGGFRTFRGGVGLFSCNVVLITLVCAAYNLTPS
ncbi:hypothetical protein F5887DRAFT_992495, partial [Amanita rubescens]